jgi:DNA-binding PadR family transcriptional regulator
MAGTVGDGSDTRATLAGGAVRLEGQHTATAQHRSPAIELFILGELMDGPHHGYLLRDILTRMLGPYHQVSWAAIYPLIHQLQQQGLIEEAGSVAENATGDRVRTGRLRRYWSITEAGRQHFAALMSADEPYTDDFPETFALKLMHLRHVAPQRRQAILTHAQIYFQRQREHMHHVFTAQSTTAHLPDEQREGIFRMTRFRLAGVAAQLRWIESELERLAGTS